MVQRIGGFRRKSRNKLKKDIRKKGKISLSRYFQNFETGDKVCLKADAGVHKGQYFPRFHGRQGFIAGKRGFCYMVLVKDGNKSKELIVHPVHLTRVVSAAAK